MAPVRYICPFRSLFYRIKDILSCCALSQVRHNACVSDLRWTPRTLCRDMLCLIQSKTLSFINCSTGGLVWEKKYSLAKEETLRQLEIDPFESSKLYLLSSSCLMKQVDFGLTPPAKSPRRIFLDKSKKSFIAPGQDLGILCR